MSPADVNAYYNSPNNYIGLLLFNPLAPNIWLVILSLAAIHFSVHEFREIGVISIWHPVADKFADSHHLVIITGSINATSLLVN